MWTARSVKALPDFHELLTQRYKHALAGNDVEVKKITAQMESRFRRTAAPLVIDLTGFSNATRATGIIAAMSVIRMYWDALQTAVTKHKGAIIKDEGDTLYALFDTAGEAVRAALELEDIIARLRKAQDLDKLFGWSPQSSIGIGYGPILDVDGDDAFGEEINYAYNAGEVEAKPNEILLTANAATAIRKSPPRGVKELVERNLGAYSLWLVVRT